MEFFKEVFAWLKDVSAKLPVIDVEMYFVIALAVIALVWVIVALTLISSRSQKLVRACKKIRKYLAGVETVDDDNVSDFTTSCFGSKVPQPLRDAWMQYFGVRYGYPSEIVSDSAVYDKYVKKNKDIRSGIYLAISLILLAVLAFWGYAVVEPIMMGTIHLLALVLIGVTYLLLNIFHRQQNKHALKAFEEMQDDLDAKVNLQVENNYATDSSPLAELNSLVEEIIARNTAKAVDEQEVTPIEELIEQAEETSEDTLVEDVVEEPVVEEDVVEEPIVEETIEEAPEATVEEVLEEPIEEIEEPIEKVEEPAEEAVEEPAEEVIEEAELEETEEVEEVEEPAEEETEEPVEEVGESVDDSEPITETEEPQIEEEESAQAEDEEQAEESEEEVSDVAQEEEPEVVYVVDGEEDEEAHVKPAKLAKLPNLVDYMLTKNMTRGMKIQLATALIGAYKKFEHSRDDRKIVVQCLTKIMTDLQK